MSKKSTSQKNFFSGQNGGTRKLSYAFTEQGIYMLMTILKGDLATKQSIALIDAFKQRKSLKKSEVQKFHIKLGRFKKTTIRIY